MFLLIAFLTNAVFLTAPGAGLAPASHLASVTCVASCETWQSLLRFAGSKQACWVVLLGRGVGTPLCVYDHREFDFLVLTQLQW